jgi:preprotein translocase subunit SecD
MTSNTRKNVIPLVATVVLVVGLFLAVLIASEGPNLGLDLQGGVSVVLQPLVNGKKTTNVKKESLDQTKQIIEKRVNAIGVGEPDVTVQGSTIVVQIPGIKDQKRALDLVGKTAELRFRPVLQNLSPTLSKADQAKISTLRKELKVPDGVSAEQVLNSEFSARGMPTIPASGQSTTDNAAATTTTAPATTAAPTTTTPGTGTGGSRSAKVARLRDAAAQTTTTAPATTSTTTTTIDPAPKNQYGIKVFKNKDGAVVSDLQTLYQLETAKSQAGLGTTKPEDDKADATVILAGNEQDQNGQKVTPRYQLGPTLLTGRAVDDASAGVNQSGQWVVNPKFKTGKDGIDLFNQAAAKCFNGDATCPTKQLGIVLDGVVISAPTIEQASFSADQIQISGSFDSNSANDLATALRYGSLPVTMQPQQVETVSATLGQGALNAALVAGAIGLGLVIAYMVFYYRLLGLVTFGALAMSGMSIWIVISFFGATAGLTLTLSGIVGIIVSIGVSLDSSVVFYENLKEDVRTGRTLRSAVDRSFTTAYGTILKADFSSLIGALVLYLLSIGPVRGFAFYLGLSTVLDLIMSYFFTRPAVALLAHSKLGERPGLFGIPTDDVRPAGVGSPALSANGAITIGGDD